LEADLITLDEAVVNEFPAKNSDEPVVMLNLLRFRGEEGRATQGNSWTAPAEPIWWMPALGG
jgi:hypothetical protein